MINSDKIRFAELLIGIAQCYRMEISKTVMRIYWDALNGYSIEEVESAFKRHILNPDTGQFMPKVADIIKMISGTSTDLAMIAWSKVDRAVRHIGVYESVVFDDPLIHVVLMEMGGWISFGNKTEDEWPFVAKEFQTRYRGYKSRNDLPAFQKSMIGITESHNSQNRFQVQKPVLIGSSKLALEVFDAGIDKKSIGFERMQPEQFLIH